MTISGPASRAWIARLIAGAIIGICVGAILGGLIFHTLSSDATATSFIRITQPVDLAAIAAGATQSTPDTNSNTENYVSGEVAYLSGHGFAQAVGNKLGKSDPADLKVAQDGHSSVVTISSTSATGDDAVKTVQAAIDVYRQQVAQRTDQQMRSILPALAQWEQVASDANNGARVQDVQNLRANIQLRAAQSSAIAVLQPPTTNDPSDHPWLIGVLFGGLVGGSLLVLGLMAYRKRSGRLTSATDISDAVDGVIVPPVDLRQPRRRSLCDKRTLLARTLYAQCPGAGPSRIIVLIGASPSSASAVVASLIKFAAAENGRVTSAKLTDGPIPSLPPADQETTLIIDVGAIGESKLTAEAIGVATDLIMVARFGADTVGQALAVRSATASSEAPLMAVFTYRPWWHSIFGIARSQPTRMNPTQRLHRMKPSLHMGECQMSAALDKGSAGLAVSVDGAPSPCSRHAVKTAIVHERLTEIAGSEHVVAELAREWPDARVSIPICGSTCVRRVQPTGGSRRSVVRAADVGLP